MTTTMPDRLSQDPKSPYHDKELLERGIGIRFNGQEKTNVWEYCVSEGWVRVVAGAALDRPLAHVRHGVQADRARVLLHGGGWGGGWGHSVSRQGLRREWPPHRSPPLSPSLERVRLSYVQQAKTAPLFFFVCVRMSQCLSAPVSSADSVPSQLLVTSRPRQQQSPRQPLPLLLCSPSCAAPSSGPSGTRGRSTAPSGTRRTP